MSSRKFVHRSPTLLTGGLDLDLKARQILVLSNGLLDAFVLMLYETNRNEQKRSQPWLHRQNPKVDGALKAMHGLAVARGPETDFLFGRVLTLADIAVLCAVG